MSKKAPVFDPDKREQLDKIKVPQLRKGETLADYYKKKKVVGDWVDYPIIGDFLYQRRKSADEFIQENIRESIYFSDMITISALSTFLVVLFLVNK